MLTTVLLENTPFSVYQAGNGTPILFVHGFPLDHQMWLGQLTEFQNGYRVIAPDLRGFGQSQGANDINTMQDYAQDLANLLDAMRIQEPVTLCGLSMGGYVAWQFALMFPQKLSRLVLCDTRAKADDEAGQQKRRELAEAVLKTGTEKLAREMPEKLFSPLTHQAAPEIVEQTRQVILQTAPRAVAAASRGMAQRPDVTSLLSKMNWPTLVVCGTDDAIVPIEEMRQLSDQLPNSEFVEIAGAGHMSPLEKPTVFNAALREFLGRTDI